MNIVIAVTYLISGISSNFRRLLLCKKCDGWYYVINHEMLLKDTFSNYLDKMEVR